ncbi:MAG: HD domain-containing phosphohydrolase [Vulcanimicrobiota bacterium]
MNTQIAMGGLVVARILLVDDDPSVLDILAEILIDSDYDVTTAKNGYEAIEKIKSGFYDLVITDIRMAGLDGLDTLANLREKQPDLKSIIMTGYASTEDPVRAIKLRVDDYLKKPFSTKDFLSSVEKSIEEYRSQNREKEERYRYRDDFISTIKQISIAIEHRDPYLYGHSEKVAQMCLQIGSRLGLSLERMENLEVAACLHDLGQVEIKQKVMQKKGPLTDEEYNEIKNHPSIARNLLSSVPRFQEVIDIILHHHERYDGSGYPSGLKSEDIPLESRILSLAESYTSLLENRPHRGSYTSDETLQILMQESGTSFDPELLEVLKSVVTGDDEDTEDIGEVREEELTRDKQRKALLELGHTYLDMGQFLVARQAYQECLQQKEEKGDPMAVDALLGLSQAALVEGSLEEAKKNVEKASLYSQSTSRYIQARVSLARGKIAATEKNSAEALQYLNQAEETFIQWEASYARATALLYKGWAHLTSTGAAMETVKACVDEALKLIRHFSFFNILVTESKVAVPLLLTMLSEPIEASSQSRSDYVEAFVTLARRAPQVCGAELERGEERKLTALLDALDRNVAATIQDALLPLLQSPTAAVREKASSLLSDLDLKAGHNGCKVYCLGNFRVFSGDRLIGEKEWKTKKSKYLLAYILSHWQDRISEEKIFELFWGDFPTQKARRSLHTALCQVRQTIEPYVEDTDPEIITHEKEYYFLNPSAKIWIDVNEFWMHAQDGIKALREGRIPEGVASLQQAESLYSGDLLEGYISEWVDLDRTSFKDKYQEVLSTLLRHFYESAQYEVSLDYAKKLLSSDNCHEKAHFYLIKCHMGMGNKVDAMRAYQSCIDILKKELDLSPPPEIESLYLLMKG